ncbi:MAG: hypothetical protein Q8933_10940 [Bacteroidota bacterium]|nr:hypothetical protein [Bacteroidota bacterium]MDP4191784.1 hypothetical protein [Bacteroidota bacterium]MDP4195989.1 hypothetical protein [Bacteroidota bacterium]
MKKLIWAAFLLISLFQIKGFSQDHGFGLGVKLGEPTGIDAKYWISDVNALDFSLGYSFMRNNSRLYLSCDYLFHLEDIIKSSERLPLYYGFGARFLSREHEDGSLGLRGVAGIDWQSRNFPIDAFFEIVPVFTLFPSTTLDMEASIGVRYFFN